MAMKSEFIKEILSLFFKFFSISSLISGSPTRVGVVENLIDIEDFKSNRSNLYKYNLYDYDNNKFTLIRKKVNGI